MTVVHVSLSLMEAQLAKLQLEQAGIGCDILDEASAANFPAGSFPQGIRLAVADEDVARARQVLHLPERESAMRSAVPRPRRVHPVWMFAAIALGLLGIALKSDRLARQRDTPDLITQDRNHDGKADWRQETKDQGKTLTIMEDNNFDGVWDGTTQMVGGNIVKSESDTDFDGEFDWKSDYENGIIVLSESRKAGKGPVLTRIAYRHGVKQNSLHDLDGDGKWDLRLEFDLYGREISRTPMK